ncbi:unnamed protein product [Blepharisma stoltei]|uniref:Uncharacterized protein n=1 Tax=Blepharisma stoltei TaxID=1481888 RepID=A0AAU9KLS6_9CILI|nr:unnamed protein product [Blepharisma stoltei]
MAVRSIIQTKHLNLKSIGAFANALPEFVEIPSNTKSLVDRAFNASIVEGQTNLKYWKDFRVEVLNKKPKYTPREFARLKWALTRSTKDFDETYLGRPVLHDWLDTEAKEMLSHMTAIELISTIGAYGSTVNDEFYETAAQLLVKELQAEENLDVISVAPYVVSNSFRHESKIIPIKIIPKQQEISVKFLEAITPLVLNRLTEFSDDQLATICGGIAGSNAPVKLRNRIHALTDSIEEEILTRRMNRMSITQMVDVVKGFTNVNLGTEKLFSNLRGKLLEKGDDLDFDSALDLGCSLSLREPISNDLQKKINSKIPITPEMKKRYLQKMSTYLFNVNSKDERMLKAYTNYIESLKYVSEYDYQYVRKMKFHIGKSFPKLLSDEFIEKYEKKGFLFMGPRLIEDIDEYQCVYMDRFKNWVTSHLRYKAAAPYLYSNHESLQCAIMPQKVALFCAFPDFWLKGKYEYDDRLVKEPKLKYEFTNEFEIKCRWLELLGWKVAKLNYHDLAENVESWQERDQFLIKYLSNLGVPAPQPPATPGSH